MIASIRFCGGCNPRIDRRLIADQLAEYLRTAAIQVVYNKSEADVIICISGCTASCAVQGMNKEQIGAVIAGPYVDGMATTEIDLSLTAIKKVRDYLGKLEKPLST
jgi:hypothetical protein